MLPITKTVEEIVRESDVALIALQQHVLNLSAYAQQIHTQVEKQTKKPVKVGTIVVALARLQKQLGTEQSLLASIKVDDLAVKSGLIELVYDATSMNQELLSALYASKKLKSAEFFTVTQGIGEISIITQAKYEADIKKVFKKQTSKKIITQLASITVRVDVSHVYIPNTIYTLTRKFALQHINIIEVISTYTEITFIVEQKYLNTAFQLLQQLLPA